MSKIYMDKGFYSYINSETDYEEEKIYNDFPSDLLGIVVDENDGNELYVFKNNIEEFYDFNGDNNGK